MMKLCVGRRQIIQNGHLIIRKAAKKGKSLNNTKSDDVRTEKIDNTSFI